MKSPTLIDIIQMYNIKHNIDIDNMEFFYNDIEIDERLDKEVLIDTILDECGAMLALYNTSNVFKRFSDNFFKKYKWNITKLADTLHFEYDPLKTKNVTWTETTDIKQELDTDESAEESRTKDNTGTRTTVGDYEETNTISAMNSSNYEPDNKSESDNSTTRTDALKEEISAETGKTKNEDLTWEETDTHTENGTEGIYQDLIEKERKIAQFSLYGWIAKKYASELFLLVY